MKKILQNPGHTLKTLFIALSLIFFSIPSFAYVIDQYPSKVERIDNCFRFDMVVRDEYGLPVGLVSVWIPYNCSPSTANKLVFNGETFIIESGSLTLEDLQKLLESTAGYASYQTAKNNAMGTSKTTFPFPKIENTNKAFHVFPNPQAAGREFTLRLQFDTDKATEPLHVNVYDATGRLVVSEQVAANQVYNDATIRMRGTQALPAGMYHVKLFSGQLPIGNTRLVLQ